MNRNHPVRSRASKTTLAAVAALVLGVALASCSGAPGADGHAADASQPISFDWGVPTASYLALYVADDAGYFEAEGLDPQFQSFTSGAPMLAAFQSESLDIGTAGLATVFALGQGIDVSLFALEGDASATEGLVARAGGSVSSLADIGSGAPIGIPTGSCAQVSAFYAAEDLGIEYTDINIVDIAPNLFANSFESASLDAGFSWSPYLVDLVADGNELIGRDGEWVPGGGACPETHFGRSSFLAENPDVPARIIRALKHAWEDMRADPSVAAAALVDRLDVDEATASEVAQRYIDAQPTFEEMLEPGTRFSFVGTDGLVAQLQLASEAFAALGVIPAPLTAEQLDAAVDDSALTAALQE